MQTLLSKVALIEPTVSTASGSILKHNLEEVKTFILACAEKNKTQIGKITMRQMASVLIEHYSLPSLKPNTLGKFIIEVFGKSFTEL